MIQRLILHREMRAHHHPRPESSLSGIEIYTGDAKANHHALGKTPGDRRAFSQEQEPSGLILQWLKGETLPDGCAIAARGEFSPIW